MQFRRLLFSLISAAFILSACSGGGSASSPGFQSSPRASAAPTAGTQSIDTQRSLSGSVLAVAGSSVDYNQLSGPQSPTVLSLQDATTLAAAAPANGPMIPGPTPPIIVNGNGTCYNGVEFTYSSTSTSITETIEFFYDLACTQPYRLENLTITPPLHGGAGTGGSSGTIQVWSQSGASVDYQTFSQTFTVNAGGLVTQISQTRTDAASSSSPPTSQYGETCLVGALTPLAAMPIDCGTGNALTDTTASEALGFVQTTTGQFILAPPPSPAPLPLPAPLPSPLPTVVPVVYNGVAAAPGSSGSTGSSGGGSSGSGTAYCGATVSSNGAVTSVAVPATPIYCGSLSSLSLTVNGTGYTGAIGSLALSPGTAPAWTIGGGTKVVTLSGTATIGFGFSSVMSSVNLTLVDSADGLTVTLTSAHGPGLTGTVTNTSSGAVVATIVVDLSGTGMITYSNGSTEQVRDWIIVG
jgi:hypothetical protein